MNTGIGCLKYVVPFLVLACSCSSLAAEEQSKVYRGFEIDLTLTGGFIKQARDWDSTPTVRMPEYMKNERYSFSSRAGYNLKANDLTDNPLWHGAAFAHLAMEAKNAGLTLYCELMAEHRGASYGVYAMKDIAIVPKFSAAIDTSFTIKSERFRAGAGAGTYDDYRLYEGLAIYNIDVQGDQFYLKWKNLKLAYSQIGDLEYGIGLNIGDQYDYIVSLEEIALYKHLKLDASAGHFIYGLSGDADKGLQANGTNFSAALHWKETIRLYSQVGIRNVDDAAYGGIDRCADLVGCTFRGGLNKLDVNMTGEYRYYGRYFNQGFRYSGNCFLYRGSELNGKCLAWNTVGRYLYPLDVYYRPFSQWAVYTDYQGRDVQTFIYRADASYKLPAECSLFCNLDLNYLDVSNEDPFLYPFYNAGVGWSPAAGTTIALSRTNRAMNLDKHYPTLYLLEKGTFLFTVQSVIAF